MVPARFIVVLNNVMKASSVGFALQKTGMQDCHTILITVMGRKKLKEGDGLLHDVKTRITQHHFDRLSKQLSNSPYRKMSELLREIICNRPITVYTVDNSLPLVMEELTRIRKELTSIGRNVNQVTRQYHTAAGRAERMTSVFQLLELSQKVDQKLELVYPIISQLSEKWLRG